MVIRSAMRLQFWIFYWNLERQRLLLSRTMPETLTAVGQPIPQEAKLIPVRTKDVNLLEHRSNMATIELRSLIKKGRHLVVNFGSCT